MTVPSRFYIPLNGDAAGSVVKAFLWLKRRIEEGNASGLLAIPDQAFLEGPLTDALGWRLVDVLKEEGCLELGHGLDMRHIALDALDVGPAQPVAALWPKASQMDRLIGWPGPALVVPSSTKSMERWIEMTGAREPAPENFWPAETKH